MFYLLAFVVLGIVVFAHELGHFLLAKRAGVTVEVFSIGFWKPLVRHTWRGTEYRISVIPWGGYVKLAGELATAETEPGPNDFAGKPAWKRITVLAAGSVFNFLFAYLIYAFILQVGYLEPTWSTRLGAVAESSPAAVAGLQAGDVVTAVNGTPVSDWQELMTVVATTPSATAIFSVERAAVRVEVPIPADVEQFPGIIGIGQFTDPVVGQTTAGYPAAAAGLRPGDRIEAAAGQPVGSFTDLVRIVRAQEGNPLPLTVRRGDELLRLTIVPKFDAEVKRHVIGIVPPAAAERMVRHPFPANLGVAAVKTWEITKMNVVCIYKLITLQLSLKAMGGPIMIVSATAEMAKIGWREMLLFVAMINVSLGVINLFPFPPTDGGMILFTVIEKLHRKRLPERVVATAQMSGIYLVLLLFVVVVYNDLTRFGWLELMKQWFSRVF